ncbi:MAG TPA: hypothetical protein VLA19_11405 [Herpetosiphonaceae bacterium]|nr:hypothetical protein [Herpetosiphonaceae bacterium]
MQNHPILSVFGETEQRDYPLLLIVGREPNGNTPMTNEVGPYDFRIHSRCGFWNTSYAMVARAVGLKTFQFKRRCVSLGGSPIVYTDALPQCVPNAVADKWSSRASITTDVIHQHIDNTFSHTRLLSRVKLVILSGLDHPVFEMSCRLIEQRCRELELRCIRLPFFHGMHSRTIHGALKEVDRELIRNVVNDFFDTARARPEEIAPAPASIG